jgi:hypothetical protein
MARELQTEIVTQEIVGLLNKLTDNNLNSTAYAETMYALGTNFGKIINSKISSNVRKIAVASTVEDADFLGKGIVDELESNGKHVLLTVFWNKRFKPNVESGITVAPIIKEFHEKGYENAEILIIIKSIISSSCVVRTNLTRLIEVSDPQRIMVVAPVLLQGATQSLEAEFDPQISKKFEYLFFALDNEKTRDGYVFPGIGGDVYKRLGFEAQETKNKFIPSIVKERRYKHL